MQLKQECCTRWNSLYEMFERIHKLKDAVSLFLVQPEAGAHGPFGGETWRFVEDAITVLRPCYEATVELSGEKFATGSKIIPMTKMLLTFYANLARECNVDTTHPLKKELASDLLANLNSRFDRVEEVRILTQATLLDPRFKNRVFRKEDKKRMHWPL